MRGVGFHFYQLEIKKILAYRVEFWVGFFGNILSQFGVAFFLWQAIFSARGISSIQGYSFGALMLYYLLVPLIERCVHGEEMGFISGEIYDGGLTRFLIYPVSYFRLKYLGQLAQTTIFFFQLAVTLMIFLALFRNPYSLSLLGTAKAIPVILLAGLLYFTMSINLEMLAFWTDNVWSISVLNRMIAHLLGGGLIPLTFFPTRIQTLLDYLPFTRLISFPIRCLLGEVSVHEWIWGMGLTTLWILFFGLLAKLVWRRGLRNYTGVGI